MKRFPANPSEYRRFRKIQHQLLIVALAGIFLLSGCSRSVPGYATRDSLERKFSAQFSRIDYYAQHFSQFLGLGGALAFPPEGSEAVDRSLFQIPEILDFSLCEVSSNTGLQAQAWTRDPLVHQRFLFTRNLETTEAKVKLGKGTTRSGREVNIAIYESTIIEKDTGKSLRCTVAFDLDELKPKQNKPTEVRH